MLRTPARLNGALGGMKHRLVNSNAQRRVVVYSPQIQNSFAPLKRDRGRAIARRFRAIAIRWALVWNIAGCLVSPSVRASENAAPSEEGAAFYLELAANMCSETMLACAGISKDTCRETIEQIKAKCPSPLPGSANDVSSGFQSESEPTGFMSCYRAKIVSRWRISIEQFRACRSKEHGLSGRADR